MSRRSVLDQRVLGSVLVSRVLQAAKIEDANHDDNDAEREDRESADERVTLHGGQGSFSSAQAGYTVGGGLEWMFLPNLSLKAEYLYYDIGSVSYSGGSTLVTNPGFAAAQAPTPGPVNQTVTRVSFRQDGSVARVGLNYHFGLPPAGY